MGRMCGKHEQFIQDGETCRYCEPSPSPSDGWFKVPAGTFAAVVEEKPSAPPQATFHEEDDRRAALEASYDTCVANSTERRAMLREIEGATQTLLLLIHELQKKAG